MKIMKLILWVVPVLCIITACTREHFITSTEYRRTVETQFKHQAELAKTREQSLFGVLKRKDLLLKEKEALIFLFAHMPLNDLADYDGEFFLNQVRKAFEARKTFSWGQKVPQELFRHFVLPYRVNNENLDYFRSIYFDELAERVKNLSMKDAVLEVNHWCHEKVTYKPTDIRTSAPCSTIKTAYGRCGEESTFTVAALRTVGIPARQCYTPRWAHCDDNHAWVEAWVEGQWYYLGACEPEPDLNMAWFTEPVRRAMLVHTKVFGQYSSDQFSSAELSTGKNQQQEEIITKTNQYTEINVINNYAKTISLQVQVKDDQQNPVKDAVVQFRLYNMAEFYPIAKKNTDAQGTCSLTVGLGDLLIWASKDNAFGYKKISAPGAGKVIIVMNKNPTDEYTEDYDIVPPITPEPLPVSQERKEENQQRLNQEDQIRTKYESTFINKVDAAALALKLELKPAEVWFYLKKSRGNWKEISHFFSKAAQPMKQWLVPLLEAISEKDIRDTPADILMGHLTHSFTFAGKMPTTHPDYFIHYVLNPRIDNEIIVDYKPFLQKAFDRAFIKKARQDISLLLDWIRKYITIHEAANYYRVPITPRGVYQLKAADEQSRDIFFVGLCRSFGIPARLEPATKKPQYFSFSRNQWLDVSFEDAQQQDNQTATKGYIRLSHDNTDNQLIPRYYTHFTLARYSEGQYHTLDYPYNQELTQFPGELELDAGHYLLVTGNRLEDGTTLCRLRFFNIIENQTLTIPVHLRQSQAMPTVYGTIDLDTEINTLKENKTVQLSELAGDKGLIIGWLDPDKEPTKHVMAEIHQWRKTFDKWGGAFVFFLDPDKMTVSLEDKYQNKLPRHHIFSIDTDTRQLRALEQAVKRTLGNTLPVFIVVNKAGQVTCLTGGYRIGIGELLMRTVLQKELTIKGSSS